MKFDVAKVLRDVSDEKARRLKKINDIGKKPKLQGEKFANQIILCVRTNDVLARIESELKYLERLAKYES